MFEEIDVRDTPLGELILRRRTSSALGGEVVHEVVLDGERLMSSHVCASERALARLGIGAAPGMEGPVLVGGLGLGITAREALASPGVTRVVVVEALAPVVEWHERGLVPLGHRLARDARCRIETGDFFARVAAPPGPGEAYRSILVDIDHSPRDLLDPGHAAFYGEHRLERLREHLLPRGSFALWSADPFPRELLDRLGRVLGDVRTHEVEFDQPMTGEVDRNWIVTARRPVTPR